MRKRTRLNTLIAAGCFAFLSQAAAQSAEWGDVTVNTGTVTKDTEGASTYRTITTSGDGILEINSTGGTLGAIEGSETDIGAVKMSGTSQIKLSPAIENIVFSTLTSTGADNKVIQVNNTTADPQILSTGTTNLGALTVAESVIGDETFSSSLTVEAQGGVVQYTGATLTNSTLNLNTAAGATISASGATNVSQGSQMVIEGTGNVTLSDITVSGSNTVQDAGGNDIVTLSSLSVNSTGTTTFGDVGLSSGTSFDTTSDGTAYAGTVEMGSLNLSGNSTAKLGSTTSTTVGEVTVLNGTVTTSGVGDVTMDSLSLTTGSATFGATGETTVTNDIDLGAGTTFNTAGAGTLNLNNLALNGAGATATLGATTSTTVSGDVTMAAGTSLTTSGAGTMQFKNLALNGADSSVVLGATGETTVTDAITLTEDTSFSTEGVGDVTVGALNVSGADTTLTFKSGVGTTTVTTTGIKDAQTVVDNQNTDKVALGAVTIEDSTVTLKNLSKNNNNFTSIELTGENTLNLAATNIADVTVKAGDTLNIDAIGTSATSNAGTITLAAGTASDPTTLTMGVESGNTLLLDNIDMNGNNRVIVNNETNAGTLTVNGVQATGDENTIVTRSTASLGNLVVGDSDTTTSGDLTVTANATTNITKIDTVAGSNVTLDAVNNTITGSSADKSNINSSHLTVTATGENGKVELAGGLNISGTSSVVNADANVNKNNKFGAISIQDGANVSLQGIKTANHSGFTYNGTNVLHVDNVELGAIDLSAGNKNLTIDTPVDDLAPPADSSYTTANVGSSDLTISATGANINGGATTLASGGSLSVSGTKVVDIADVTATNGSTYEENAAKVSITNTNTAAKFGDITLTNVNADISGILTANRDSFDFNGQNVINTTNTDLGDFALEDKLTINAISGTTTVGTNATSGGVLFVSDASAELALDSAADATLTATTLKMQGSDKLTTSGAGNLTIDSLTVYGADNTYTNTNTSTASTKDVDAVTLNSSADLEISAESETSLGSALLNAGTESDLTKLSLTATVDTNENKDGSISLQTLSLAGNSEVTLNGNGAITIEAESPISEILISGTNNTINNLNTNTTDTNIGAIEMLNGAELTIKNVTADQHDGFVLNGTNTINSEGSGLGDLELKTATGDNLTVRSNEHETTYSSALLDNGSDLTLNAQTAGITGGTTTLTDGSVLTLQGSQIIDIDGVVASGEVEVDNNNTNVNTSLGAISLDGADLTISDVAASQHDGITLTGTNTINSTNTGLGALTIGSTTESSNLTINADGGTTTFTTAGVSSGSNFTINATDGAVTSTGVTTLNNGASLVIGASSKNVTLGGVNINGDVSITNANTAAGTSLGALTVAEGSNFDMTNSTIEKITVGNITLTDNPTLSLDAVYSNDGGNAVVETDQVIVDGTVNGKFDLVIDEVDGATNSERFVKYVKVVDADDSVLITTKDTQQHYYKNTDDNSVYYSYLDGADDVNDNYANNTVRITNYDIGSDDLLDNLTLQGVRDWQPNDNTHLAADTGITALPNMEAREGVENTITIQSIGTISGSNLAESINTQGLMVDTRDDNIARTMNLKGSTYDQFESDASRTNNSGNGAVLYVNSDVSSAPATVNITSYSSAGTIKQPLFQNNSAVGFETTDPTTGLPVIDGGLGGAIYNSGVASTINVADASEAVTDIEFKNNTATAFGGAIANLNDAEINFSNNRTTFADNEAKQAGGGAIFNNDATITMSGKEVIFSGNKAGGAGGAIFNENATFTMAGQLSEFTDNTAGRDGGAIASRNNDFENTSEVLIAKDNVAGTNGGAISNIASTQKFKNGSQEFINNRATAGRGGAIYMQGTSTTDVSGNVLVTPAVIDLAVTRENSTSLFQGNTDSTGNNAIYLDGNATLNLEAAKGSKFIFNDKIASSQTENNSIVQKSGSAYYNNDNSEYSGAFYLSGGDAYFTDKDSVAFQGGMYKLYGGSTLHLDNGSIDRINATLLDLSETTLANPAKMTVDLNLTTELADRFELADSTSGHILVSGINIEGDTNKEKIKFEIAKGADFQVAEEYSLITPEKSLYDYAVTGEKDGLLLTRGALDTALFAPQVAANARLANQLAMYNQVLQRVDEIAETRYFNKVDKTNLYASAHDVIDNKYTPYVNQEDGGNVWIKPSVTLEKVNTEGAVDYKNRAYNTILGYETPVSTLRNGWELINTVFGGYQGSFQRYDKVENTQNGGVGGYMANLYKNDFFAGGVLMVGGTHVDVKDKGIRNRDLTFGLFDVGGAARVGYNVGMGKHWLFQPMFTTSYTFISGIDQHNDAGDSVKMKGTNTIQISPGFKIVGNYSGWQPYMVVDYTWPLIAKTVADVNDIGLEKLKLRSYIEYGVGFRKNVGDRFTGYAEAVMRNGGRTGPSLQGGLIFKF